MGLDRAPGGKTIRHKLAWLAAVGELIMVVGRHHAAAKPHALGSFTALAAALALTPAPHGFTVAEHAARVCAMTGQAGYTIRQAAYDLRKLRGKNLITKPGRSRRYHVPPQAARTIASLLALRDQVIGPILAGVRSPRMGRKPAVWTRVDRDYETLRIGMQTLFHDLGVTPVTPAA